MYTVWKCQDFSVIQILREINFGESRSSETAIFRNFRGSLNFAYLLAFKSEKNLKNQNSEPVNVLKW